jgi:hypothetical protein
MGEIGLVELSMAQTIGLLRLASLGKMIGGLIHNINGPMQNLGLEIDMSSYFINNASKQDEIPIDDIQKRLHRMGEEFNKINLLIKNIAVRADINHEYFALLNFNDFLEKELEFYHANLYFKHNVEVNLELQDNPPMVGDLPKNSVLALGWLILFIIEELENQQGKNLEIKTEKKDNTLDMIIRTDKIRIPEDFLNRIAGEPAEDGIPLQEGQNIVLNIVAMIFGTSGISLKDNPPASNSTEITLTIPV